MVVAGGGMIVRGQSFGINRHGRAEQDSTYDQGNDASPQTGHIWVGGRIVRTQGHPQYFNPKRGISFTHGPILRFRIERLSLAMRCLTRTPLLGRNAPAGAGGVISIWSYFSHLDRYTGLMQGGEIIREARHRAGLSQKQLAERLGTTQSVITRWETGRRSPTFEALVRAVRACGLDLAITLAAADPDHELMLRENLRLSPAQRLERLTEQVAGLDELASSRISS